MSKAPSSTAKVRDRSGDKARYLAKRARIIAERAPDPIYALSDVDRAYIAGIIDGEGSLHVASLGARRGNKTCHPVLAIAMTDMGVVAWLALVLGVALSSMSRRGTGYLPQYLARVSGKRCQTLCQALLPYLRVKRRQAELVLSFPADGRVAPGVKIAQSELNSMRWRLRDEINGLNFKPRNPTYRRAKRS